MFHTIGYLSSACSFRITFPPNAAFQLSSTLTFHFPALPPSILYLTFFSIVQHFCLAGSCFARYVLTFTVCLTSPPPTENVSGRPGTALGRAGGGQGRCSAPSRNGTAERPTHHLNPALLDVWNVVPAPFSEAIVTGHYDIRKGQAKCCGADPDPLDSYT